VVCADELGPVIPRSFPPAPGWTPDGHRVKALLDYGRGPEKTWVYGALRPGDGQAVTMAALAQLGRLPAPAGRRRGRQPGGDHRGDHRQPLQPQQLLDSYLAG